jgi:spermidine synthase
MEQVSSLQPVSGDRPLTRNQRRLLLSAAAISSSCGLAIELLLGTLASYLVGNQALAYGVAVGGFLAAMGLGAYLSRFIAQSDRPDQLQTAFVWVELLMAPLSALLPLGLFGLFVINGSFWLGLCLATVLLGTVAGMELPLLTRLLEKDAELREALAGALAWDYLGALLGSLLFPIVLLPSLGLLPSAALIGAAPAFMVALLGRVFPVMRRWGYVGLSLGIALCLLTPAVIPLGDRLEDNLYRAPIVARVQSTYQRIVLTRRAQDLRLFLDGDLQFSSVDEYRYHEALVHPAMSSNQLLRGDRPTNDSLNRRVLILGAGDGLALREVLKWPDVERVVVVDLDPAVVNLAKRHPFLVQANANAFADRRVQVIHADAFTVAPRLPDTFDVIIADFPDPDRDILAKLYAEGFYRRLLARLAPKGVLVTQASSPFFAPKAFACVVATLEATGLNAYPYLAEVPSFGLWGFVLAARSPVTIAQLNLPIATRFLTPASMQQLFTLPKDIVLGGVEVNRLAHPVIVRYQSDARWATYD